MALLGATVVVVAFVVVVNIVVIVDVVVNVVVVVAFLESSIFRINSINILCNQEEAS